MAYGPYGDLVAIRDGAGTRLQLTNLHDDDVAEASSNASSKQLTVLGEATESGTPRQPIAQRRRWLGGKKRSRSSARDHPHGRSHIRPECGSLL
jgi:hypothetical protein